MCERLPAAFTNEIQDSFPAAEAAALLSALKEPAKYALRWQPQRVRGTDFWPAPAGTASPGEAFTGAAFPGAAGAKPAHPAAETAPVHSDRVPWEPWGEYYDPARLAPGKAVLHEAGAYYVQEPSAMAPAAFLMEGIFESRDTASGTGLRVLDLCAAPGGKATQIAGRLSLTAPEALLMANEPVPSRARILSENMERCGVSDVIVTSMEPAALAARFPAYFDAVLVDAPCSGEGMFRKHPEVMGEWSPEAVEKCAMRQAGILDAAAKLLSPGGCLVYSTCTFNRRENEETVRSFLARREDMRLMDAAGMACFTGGMTPGIDLPEAVRLLPHRVRGEGHFLSVMTREGDSDGASKEAPPVPAGKKKKGGKRTASTGTVSLRDVPGYQTFAKEYLPEALHEGSALLFGEQLYRLPPGGPPLDGLKVLRPGLHLGNLRKDRFEPAHALSRVLSPADFLNTRELSEEEARAWLRGEGFPWGERAGWYLLTVRGMSLGFGKCAGGTMKNHYPKGLRRP